MQTSNHARDTNVSVSIAKILKSKVIYIQCNVTFFEVSFIFLLLSQASSDASLLNFNSRTLYLRLYLLLFSYLTDTPEVHRNLLSSILIIGKVSYSLILSNLSGMKLLRLCIFVFLSLAVNLTSHV